MNLATAFPELNVGQLQMLDRYVKNAVTDELEKVLGQSIYQGENCYLHYAVSTDYIRDRLKTLKGQV